MGADPFIAAYLAAVNGSAPMGYSSFSQIVGNPALSYNSLFTNFFAQDSWKPVRNLTVTYGLRYDLYQMPAADKTSPFVYSQNFRTDKNNFGPRLGFAYGLGKDQKTVIRASSGIFYDSPQTDQYRRAISLFSQTAVLSSAAAAGAASRPRRPPHRRRISIAGQSPLTATRRSSRCRRRRPRVSRRRSRTRLRPPRRASPGAPISLPSRRTSPIFIRSMRISR